MDPDELANCYLRSALVLLHGNARLPYGADPRRSALKLQIKTILGKPLFRALRGAGDPRVDYVRFIGCTDGGIGDHVVPLDEIVGYAARNLRQFPRHDVAGFREFVASRTHMAYIPPEINSLLASFGMRHRMPNNAWETDSTPTSIWARYIALGIPAPGEAGSPFGDF